MDKIFKGESPYARIQRWIVDINICSCQIYVEGEQRQKVRSASRTKALLHNLALDTAMEISVTSTNKVSRAAVLRTKSLSNTPARRRRSRRRRWRATVPTWSWWPASGAWSCPVRRRRTYKVLICDCDQSYSI